MTLDFPKKRLHKQFCFSFSFKALFRYSLIFCSLHDKHWITERNHNLIETVKEKFVFIPFLLPDTSFKIKITNTCCTDKSLKCGGRCAKFLQIIQKMVTAAQKLERAEMLFQVLQH